MQYCRLLTVNRRLWSSAAHQALVGIFFGGVGGWGEGIFRALKQKTRFIKLIF